MKSSDAVGKRIARIVQRPHRRVGDICAIDAIILDDGTELRFGVYLVDECGEPAACVEVVRPT